MTSLVLRPLTESDITQTPGLFHSVRDELHGDNPAVRDGHNQQHTKERLQTLLPDAATIFLAVDIHDAQLGFGFGRTYGGIGFLHWIGLHPNKPGSNMGQKMIDYFFDQLKNHECHKAELYTYQNRPKPKLLYERSGFKETSQLNHHGFHLGIYYMTKQL